MFKLLIRNVTPLVVLVLWPVLAQGVGKASDTTAPASDTAKPQKANASEDWTTKSFDLQYADPERLRGMFAGRSYVMEADRDLKVLTVHGPAAFLKEVEDAVKRFDSPPVPSANVQITVYLLTPAAQAPLGTALPKELDSLSKEVGSVKLADLRVLRVREGQPGEAGGPATAPNNAQIARVRVQSTVVLPGLKSETVSINGLQLWLDIPAAPNGPGAAPASSSNSPFNNNPDVFADVDVEPSQAVIVSKAGLDKPVAVVVRAAVMR